MWCIYTLAQTTGSTANGTLTQCPNVTGMPSANWTSLHGLWYELAIAPNNTNTAIKCPYMQLMPTAYNNKIDFNTQQPLTTSFPNSTITQSPAMFSLTVTY
ncbi:unnamed protein product [Oppiella nova]|uniref:Uncharacterized protein n=1 Tax=Oppiella nova TaxID=334625 RepID=A0A7R9LYM3_9ACAR|nr:unnamed protein product [Oppiella nova]CAG2168270.1 unnamed protein product [Oppiella nova]